MVGCCEYFNQLKPDPVSISFDGFSRLTGGAVKLDQDCKPQAELNRSFVFHRPSRSGKISVRKGSPMQTNKRFCFICDNASRFFAAVHCIVKGRPLGRVSTGKKVSVPNS